MIGLLKKDIYELKSQFLLILFLIIAYAIYGKMIGSTTYVIFLSTFILSMLPITTLGYDEQSKWTPYCMTLPITKKQFVLSKYLLGFLGAVLSTTIGIVFSLCSEVSLSDSFQVPITFGFIGLIMLSFLLPITFKLGVEKGRLFIFFIAFLPTFLIIMISKTKSPIVEFLVNNILLVSSITGVLVIIASILLSIRIVNKKEL